MLESDAQLHALALAVLKGVIDAEGYLSTSLSRQSLEQSCGVVSASPSLPISASALLQCTLGMSPGECHLYVRMANEEREEGYVPDGQRDRKAAESAPGEDALLGDFLAALVSEQLCKAA